MTKKHIEIKFDRESYDYARAVLDASGLPWNENLEEINDKFVRVRVYTRNRSKAIKIGGLVADVVKLCGHEVFPHK